MTTRRRPGVTLAELLVVLALLGLLGALVAFDGVTLSRSRTEPPSTRERMRRHALATARETTAVVIEGDRARLVTALPDGRVLP